MSLLQKKKVVVLGASGMLGHMAVRVLAKDHDVIGMTRSPAMSSAPLARFLALSNWLGDVDLHDQQMLSDVFEDLQPDVVVNCVGVIKQKTSNVDTAENIYVNSYLPHKLAGICEVVHAKLIHISTDCVFSCRPGIKTQTQSPDCTDLYGLSKSLGEVTYGSALTLRTSIVGRQLTGSDSLFEWIISQRGNRVSGYKNALYTGLTTEALSQVISNIIQDHFDLSGLWQVASEAISKYELVTRLNHLLNLGIDITGDETFICDRRLDGSPFVARTGIEIPSWDNMLKQFAADQATYNLSRGMAT